MTAHGLTQTPHDVTLLLDRAPIHPPRPARTPVPPTALRRWGEQAVAFVVVSLTTAGLVYWLTKFIW
jgi:hypothetical protein